jgi:hypothetical protein
VSCCFRHMWLEHSQGKFLAGYMFVVCSTKVGTVAAQRSRLRSKSRSRTRVTHEHKVEHPLLCPGMVLLFCVKHPSLPRQPPRGAQSAVLLLYSLIFLFFTVLRCSQPPEPGVPAIARILCVQKAEMRNLCSELLKCCYSSAAYRSARAT